MARAPTVLKSAPNSTLIFEIELVSIKPKPAAAAAPAPPGNQASRSCQDQAGRPREVTTGSYPKVAGGVVAHSPRSHGSRLRSPSLPCTRRRSCASCRRSRRSWHCLHGLHDTGIKFAPFRVPHPLAQRRCSLFLVTFCPEALSRSTWRRSSSGSILSSTIGFSCSSGKSFTPTRICSLLSTDFWNSYGRVLNLLLHKSALDGLQHSAHRIDLLRYSAARSQSHWSRLST